MNKYFLIYLAVINLLVFVVFAIDKRKAKTNNYRISEKQLLILSGVGGWIGAILSMTIFYHKISKGSFLIKFWGIVFVEMGLLIWLYFR